MEDKTIYKIVNEDSKKLSYFVLKLYHNTIANYLGLIEKNIMRQLVLIILLSTSIHSFAQISTDEKHQYLASLYYHGLEAMESGNYSKAFTSLVSR